MNNESLDLSVKILSWIVLIIIAGAFETAEVALASLRAREIVESDDGSRNTVNLWLRRGADIRATAAVWSSILLSSAIVVSVLVANCIAGSGETVIIIAVIVFGIFVTVLIGKLIPRYLGAGLSERVVFKMVKVVYGWTIITYHFNSILLKSAELVSGMFGIKNETQLFASDNDDSALSEKIEKDESIEAEEHEMIKSIFEFGDTVVREVMTPRTEIIAVPVSCGLAEAIDIALDAGHSRLPVYDGNVDKITGVFYVRDALKYWNTRDNAELPDIHAIMHKTFFVPETKKVNELLAEFRAKKTQLTVIIDEYGGTAGLASLEDLVEEIVGEIHDEFDVDEEEQYEQLDTNTFIIDAGTLVDDINDDLEIHLPEDEDFDTVGGYVMYKLGHMPKTGEVINEKEFVIKIIKVTDRRVEKIELTRLTDTEDLKK